MTNTETTDRPAAAAAQGATVAPEKASSKKGASRKKGAPKAKKAAKTAKAGKERGAGKRAPKAQPGIPREFSKKNIVIEVLRRKEGATISEIAQATQWQNHSIRGFISGTLTKKMGLAVTSAKEKGGERTYSIKG